MRLADFEAMVRRMADEIPPEFLEGVAEITVSPRVVPHPERPGIFTLGECVALPAPTDEPAAVQSRVLLYHGSFAALAREHSDFDWREEAWETLTHEIRHHVEWRARSPDLEALDRAAEENYARLDGEAFDPAFYRDGERLPSGLYRVEDDYFIELPSDAAPGSPARFRWAGRGYRITLPAELEPPAFVSVWGVEAPPPGDLVLVVPSRGGLRGLFRPRRPRRYEADATAADDEPAG